MIVEDPKKHEAIIRLIRATQEFNVQGIPKIIEITGMDAFEVRPLVELACRKKLIKYFNGNYVKTGTGKKVLEEYPS